MGLKALQLMGLIDKKYLEEDSAPRGTSPGPAASALASGVNVNWSNMGNSQGGPKGYLGPAPSNPLALVTPSKTIVYKDPSMIHKKKKKKKSKKPILQLRGNR